MDPGAYLAGVLLLGIAVGSTGFAADRVCGRLVPELMGPARVVAIALLMMSALALSVLLPSALGVLTRATFAGCTVALAVGSEFTRRVRLPPPRSTRSRPPLAVAIPALAGLLLGVWIFGEALHITTMPPMGTDFISYDLPIIGRWIQSGSVWHITELFPLQTHGTYPQNADLVLAALVLPFHNDAFVGIVPCVALGVTGIAMYGAARELTAPRPTALVCAAMFCGAPTIAWDIQAAPPDAVALAAFAAGLMFLLRHVRTHLTADLVLAGLGLGFAGGSLWYYSSAVALIVVTWVVTALPPGCVAGSKSWRQALKSAAILVGVTVVVSGFWLIRNLIETGDPFYPVKVVIGGITIFSAPPDLYRTISGFSIADYLGNAHVLRHFILPALSKALGLAGLIVLAGFGLVAGRWVVRRRRPPGVMLILLAISLLLALLYIVTPYSAFGSKAHPTLAWVNVRYVIPALGVALPPAAAAFGSLRGRARIAIELAAAVAVAQGIHEAYAVTSTGRRDLSIGAVIAFAAAAAAWIWWTRSARHVASRAARLSVIAATLAGVAVLGYASQRQVNSTRYAAYDPTYAWIQHHPAPLRVGLAGSFNFDSLSPAWPMFGEHIQNRVSFVGRLRRGHLTQFRTRAAWLQALRGGHYDVVEIAIGKPPPDTTDAEPRWAAETGLKVIVHSPSFELVEAPR